MMNAQCVSGDVKSRVRDSRSNCSSFSSTSGESDWLADALVDAVGVVLVWFATGLFALFITVHLLPQSNVAPRGAGLVPARLRRYRV